MSPRRRGCTRRRGGLPGHLLTPSQRRRALLPAISHDPVLPRASPPSVLSLQLPTPPPLPATQPLSPRARPLAVTPLCCETVRRRRSRRCAGLSASVLHESATAGAATSIDFSPLPALVTVPRWYSQQGGVHSTRPTFPPRPTGGALRAPRRLVGGRHGASDERHAAPPTIKANPFPLSFGQRCLFFLIDGPASQTRSHSPRASNVLHPLCGRDDLHPRHRFSCTRFCAESPMALARPVRRGADQPDRKSVV